MEVRQLEQFVAVAEERSFTRAAHRLHVVQSAVSTAVRALERELDAALFTRTTRRVELTDAGRALLVEARRVLRDLDAARDAVAAVRGGLRGTLRLGIMQSPTLVDQGGLISRFHRLHPGVRIAPRTALRGSDELTASVAAGRLDLAFTGTVEAPAGVTLLPLAAEPMLLACAPGHPLAERDVVDLPDLAGQEFVDFPHGWGSRHGADRTLADAGIDRSITIEVPDVATVVELVRAGLGLALLPRAVIARTDGVVLRPVRGGPTFAVSLAVRADAGPPAAARAFVDLVRGA